MTDKPRFTLTLTLRDNHGFEQPPSMAIACDEVLRISSRAVDDMKMGFGPSMEAVVMLMRTREFRRDIFRQVAVQLAAQMADRMEDAEGWHDADRIEPARKQLGGRWE